MEKTKVLLTGDNGSVHVQKWIEALAKEPLLELHVATFEKGVLFDGVHYHFFSNYFNNKLDYLLNIPRFRRLCKKIKPDLVHAHYATSHGFMGAALNFHPYLLTGWGADIFDSPKKPLMKIMLRYALAKADAITVLSKITANEIQKLTSKSAQLIPFGVATNKFKANPKINDGLFRIGTIRTLTEKYGVEYLVKAFAMLYPKYPHIRLEIVGDGPLKASLQMLAQELGISHVTSFHGFVSQTSAFDRYLSLLNSFDVFCILSVIDSETFGVAAVEASACAIPVVATRVGGLPEVVSDGETGILVTPRDPKETAAALEKLILNEQLCRDLGENGRVRVAQLYDWQQNVNTMVNLYLSMVKNYTRLQSAQK